MILDQLGIPLIDICVSSLVCLILFWYCRRKFCLGHSWGEQALISTLVRSAKLWEKNWLGATLLIKAYSCAIVESPWVTSLWKFLSLERRFLYFFEELLTVVAICYPPYFMYMYIKLLFCITIHFIFYLIIVSRL